MKLERLAPAPGRLADFYDEALTSLGALCERTWHDRLEVVAEGPSARLWNDGGALHEIELRFPPPEDVAPRDATREVFPGCPLTFRLAEAVCPAPPALERVVLAGEGDARPPTLDVAEKRWRAQFQDTDRWHVAAPFVRGYHFSLVALVRAELQAIDQHWSLRRIAVSLADGAPDEALAQAVDLVELDPQPADDITWPTIEPERWHHVLRNAWTQDLQADLAAVRSRQAQYLRRELERLDDYFEHYEQELAARAARTTNANTKLKAAGRLAAAQAEHARRRADQLVRHEIHARAHLEALLLVAETAWHTCLQVGRAHRPVELAACFVPRARWWVLAPGPDNPGGA